MKRVADDIEILRITCIKTVWNQNKQSFQAKPLKHPLNPNVVFQLELPSPGYNVSNYATCWLHSGLWTGLQVWDIFGSCTNHLFVLKFNASSDDWISGPSYVWYIWWKQNRYCVIAAFLKFLQQVQYSANIDGRRIFFIHRGHIFELHKKVQLTMRCAVHRILGYAPDVVSGRLYKQRHFVWYTNIQ